MVTALSKQPIIDAEERRNERVEASLLGDEWQGRSVTRNTERSCDPLLQYIQEVTSDNLTTDLLYVIGQYSLDFLLKNIEKEPSSFTPFVKTELLCALQHKVPIITAENVIAIFDQLIKEKNKELIQLFHKVIADQAEILLAPFLPCQLLQLAEQCVQADTAKELFIHIQNEFLKNEAKKFKRCTPEEKQRLTVLIGRTKHVLSDFFAFL